VSGELNIREIDEVIVVDFINETSFNAECAKDAEKDAEFENDD
jgi:hypothetical protein